MNKDLNLLNIIRLETELENAIGNRDAFLCGNDWNMVNMWQSIIDEIIEEIITLGEKWNDKSTNRSLIRCIKRYQL